MNVVSEVMQLFASAYWESDPPLTAYPGEDLSRTITGYLTVEEDRIRNFGFSIGVVHHPRISYSDLLPGDL